MQPANLKNESQKNKAKPIWKRGREHKQNQRQFRRLKKVFRFIISTLLSPTMTESPICASKIDISSRGKNTSFYLYNTDFTILPGNKINFV
jgi:hypothetical protein